MTVHFPFQNTYSALPANFFARVAPTPVAAPRLIKLNRALAVHLGLDPDVLESPEGAEILAGKRLPEGADPIAMAYAGHQFGQFVPQLGDGRAILLGEVIDKDGVRRDIQLKGSGPTPFSRRGDGRAALGPVLREYIVSEAMFALGSPTTRSDPRVSPSFTPCQAAVTQRPRLTWCSNSSRKSLIMLSTGVTAASPKGQNVLPRMLSDTSSRRSRSSGRPCPSSIRCRIFTNQPVPSRQGVHLPHDSCQ